MLTTKSIWTLVAVAGMVTPLVASPVPGAYTLLKAGMMVVEGGGVAAPTTTGTLAELLENPDGLRTEATAILKPACVLAAAFAGTATSTVTFWVKPVGGGAPEAAVARAPWGCCRN